MVNFSAVEFHVAAHQKEDGRIVRSQECKHELFVGFWHKLLDVCEADVALQVDYSEDEKAKFFLEGCVSKYC